MQAKKYYVGICDEWMMLNDIFEVEVEEDVKFFDGHELCSFEEAKDQMLDWLDSQVLEAETEEERNGLLEEIEFLEGAKSFAEFGHSVTHSPSGLSAGQT